MVQLIVGNKGKGKTKQMLEKVNQAVLSAKGNICYLDVSTKNMYELNNKVRLINISEYLIGSADEFTGFISGIISQDHDLEQMYLDGLLKIDCLETKDVASVVTKLDKISKAFNVDFVVSLSMDESELPDAVKSYIMISL